MRIVIETEDAGEALAMLRAVMKRPVEAVKPPPPPTPLVEPSALVSPVVVPPVMMPPVAPPRVVEPSVPESVVNRAVSPAPEAPKGWPPAVMPVNAPAPESVVNRAFPVEAPMMPESVVNRAFSGRPVVMPVNAPAPTIAVVPPPPPPAWNAPESAVNHPIIPGWSVQAPAPPPEPVDTGAMLEARCEAALAVERESVPDFAERGCGRPDLFHARMLADADLWFWKHPSVETARERNRLREGPEAAAILSRVHDLGESIRDALEYDPVEGLRLKDGGVKCPTR